MWPYWTVLYSNCLDGKLMADNLWLTSNGEQQGSYSSWQVSLQGNQTSVSQTINGTCLQAQEDRLSLTITSHDRPPNHRQVSISTKYLSLFILSGAYLLLNAAFYDGEILHADTYRPCAGHVLGFTSMAVVITTIMTFFQNACSR